jgi:hypothetical protein
VCQALLTDGGVVDLVTRTQVVRRASLRRRRGCLLLKGLWSRGPGRPPLSHPSPFGPDFNPQLLTATPAARHPQAEYNPRGGIIVTENGVAVEEAGVAEALKDIERAVYLKRYLTGEAAACCVCVCVCVCVIVCLCGVYFWVQMCGQQCILSWCVGCM